CTTKRLGVFRLVVSPLPRGVQVHKAEKIARERLKEKETPAMLAALGDLTQDPECWQRAWDLSGGRYARAKVGMMYRYLR
ncbi:unnamed protein product, partial [Hapterophycus canaliculatus]